MAGFEGLIAWQKARALAKNIYQVSSAGNFAKDFGLKDQIRRASVSVMSNIAEGYDRGGRAEFHLLERGRMQLILQMLKELGPTKIPWLGNRVLDFEAWSAS